MDEADVYADPAGRVPVGPPRRRQGQGKMLSGHVPVRFSPSVIAWVRALAAEDGLTVSAWIRSLVEREVDRRMPIERSSLPTGHPHSAGSSITRSPLTRPRKPLVRLIR